MDVEAFIKALSDTSRKIREDHHLTLGALIRYLEVQRPDALVVTDIGGGVNGSTSYRGYYEDLALEPVEKPGTLRFAGSMVATPHTCLPH